MNNAATIKETKKRQTPWSLHLVDGLLAILILVLPFIMGGRESWGHWFVISASFLLGAAWCLHSAIRGGRYQVSWLELFLLAGLAIAWFQVQPQAPSAMSRFSEEYDRLLPIWASTQPESESSPHWNTLSLTPVETRHAIWMWAAYCVVFVVGFQRIRSEKDCRRLLQTVGISGVIMTAFGLFQWATSNGKFFWYYEHPYTDTSEHLKGAFTNRNHFAQFLSLTIGPLLWWLFRELKIYISGRTESQKSTFGKQLTLEILLLLCAVSIVGLAILLSLSRGGMISAGAVTLIAMIGLWRGFKVGGAMAGMLLGSGLLVFSLLAFSDQEQLQVKLDQLISGDADKIDVGGHRRAVWIADSKVIEKFPFLGTGVGSHRDVYSIYMDDYADYAMAEMTHAESSFVHVALETGLIGSGLLIFALLLMLGRLVIGALRKSENASVAVTVIAAAVGAILHAVVDFIWYVPAIVVISLLLLAVGLRAARGFHHRSTAGLWIPRPAWAILCGCCILGLITAQPELFRRIAGERHWYAALRTKLDVPNDKTDGFEDLEGGDAVTFDNEPERLSDEEEARRDAERIERFQLGQLRFYAERVSHLHRSLQANPQQHRAQALMADDLLKLFDLLQIRSQSHMPLNMVRDAALVSEFQSSDELHNWANRACGKTIQLVAMSSELSRKSLAQCPVQGYAYVSLMESNFMRDPADELHDELIDQAMLVRGYDPRVRFVAGREAMMSGEQQRALELWESVFHSAQSFRLNVLNSVANQVPVEFFIAQFHPNVEELKDLLAIYRSLERERDVRVVLDQLCDAIPKEAPDIEDEDERLEEMLLAYNAAAELEDYERAVKLLVPMIDEFPLAFEPRYYLGATLVELERPKEAMPHLQWCHEHDPGNIWVPKLIARARRLMIEPLSSRRTHLNRLSRLKSRRSQRQQTPENTGQSPGGIESAAIIP